jgi:hypothetical protein
MIMVVRSPLEPATVSGHALVDLLVASFWRERPASSALRCTAVLVPVGR